jgi:hypothetical protein
VIGTSDYRLRVPEATIFPERLFMRLIKGSLAGPVLAGIRMKKPVWQGSDVSRCASESRRKGVNDDHRRSE